MEPLPGEVGSPTDYTFEKTTLQVVFSFLAPTLLAPQTRINTGSAKKFPFHLLGAQIWAKRGFLHVVSPLVIPHFRQPDLLLMIGG